MRARRRWTTLTVLMVLCALLLAQACADSGEGQRNGERPTTGATPTADVAHTTTAAPESAEGFSLADACFLSDEEVEQLTGFSLLSGAGKVIPPTEQSADWQGYWIALCEYYEEPLPQSGRQTHVGSWLAIRDPAFATSPAGPASVRDYFEQEKPEAIATPIPGVGDDAYTVLGFSLLWSIRGISDGVYFKVEVTWKDPPGEAVAMATIERLGKELVARLPSVAKINE